jgi:hypothetical protein
MTSLRPNRVQPPIVRAVLEDALGPAAADEILEALDFGSVPTLRPAGPRDIASLRDELRPFSKLYRALSGRVGAASALAHARAAIVRSGLEAHAAMREAQEAELTESPRGEGAPRIGRPDGGPDPGPDSEHEPPPLNVVSPPSPSFHMAPGELQSSFGRAMAYFACDGRLFRYDADEVRFHITRCGWCRAMELEGTPELIEFFCETDERFMDEHPTHRLTLNGTIGRGAAVCDFRFSRRGDDGGETQ